MMLQTLANFCWNLVKGRINIHKIDVCAAYGEVINSRSQGCKGKPGGPGPSYFGGEFPITHGSCSVPRREQKVTFKLHQMFLY